MPTDVLTPALISGVLLLLGFTLYRLWVVNGDLRAIRVALTGYSGRDGIVNDMREVKHLVNMLQSDVTRIKAHVGL